MHIGVFILLLLSGERNFGVRLNKPYTASVPMDIPVFTGEIMLIAAVGLPLWMNYHLTVMNGIKQNERSLSSQ